HGMAHHNAYDLFLANIDRFLDCIESRAFGGKERDPVTRVRHYAVVSYYYGFLRCTLRAQMRAGESSPLWFPAAESWQAWRNEFAVLYDLYEDTYEEQMF